MAAETRLICAVLAFYKTDRAPPLQYRDEKRLFFRRFAMKIAQIAAVRKLPPKLYGGTERIVSYLTEDGAAGS